MRKSFIPIIFVLVMLLSGCGAKPYVDVKSSDYATLQLIPKSETLIFTDDYYAFITDFSKGCNNENSLGIVETDSDTPSRIIKIPSEKPLVVNVNYRVKSNNSTYTEYYTFLLTAEKNKNYIVEYFKKDVGLFETISDFYVYEKDGNKEVDIPKSRIRRSFDYNIECSK